MLWHEWLSVLAVVLAAAALLLVVLALTGRVGTGLVRRTTDGRRASDVRAAEDAAALVRDTAPPRPPAEQIAFVVNPTKPAAAELRETALTACASRYLPEPLWFETTLEDPGVGQARAALAAGADVVVACGGDGTVRAVAEGLVGTGTTMAVLPLGTGNLLARNLDLSLGRHEDMLRTALTPGNDRAIDVGWLRIVRDGAGRERDSRTSGDVRPRRRADEASDDEHLFLVIAGIGIDAAMVADADEDLKKRVGWIAYFLSAARHLHGRRLRMRLRLDDSGPVPAQVRSLLIGNCGRLPGGINLLPDAVIDDGWLDVAALDTRGGVAGWAQLFGTVMLQGVGVRSNDLPGRIGRIDHARARSLRVMIERSEQVQVDGELIGAAREITARVDPGALVVRGR